MIKVNIVTEDISVGRIKRRICEKIIKFNDADIEYTISNPPRNDVDINLYNCFNEFLSWGPSKVKNVCYVTHIHKSIKDHERETGKSFNLFNECDGFLHKSNRTFNQFIEGNIATDKYHKVIWCGIESEKFKPTIKLGIIQNGEVEGKGLFFLNSLLSRYDFKNFKFIFQGIGWELVIRKLQKLGIRYEYNDNLDYDNYPKVYENLDYLLVPSLWEGGPMAPLEAMHCGVPIISSDVGWVKEIAPSSKIYKPGDTQGLISILKDIETKKISQYRFLDRYTCNAFSNRIAENLIRINNG